MKEIKHEDIHLGRNCTYCSGRNTIVERFKLYLDGSGNFHMTNEFMCQNCKYEIQPNAKNNLKTFEHRENVRKFLMGFTMYSVLLKINEVEIYQESSKRVRGFAEGQAVFLPRTENALEQYTLDLDGFKNDDHFITIFTFNESYEPTPFLVPRDAIIKKTREQNT